MYMCAMSINIIFSDIQNKKAIKISLNRLKYLYINHYQGQSLYANNKDIKAAFRENGHDSPIEKNSLDIL